MIDIGPAKEQLVPNQAAIEDAIRVSDVETMLETIMNAFESC